MVKPTVRHVRNVQDMYVKEALAVDESASEGKMVVKCLSTVPRNVYLMNFHRSRLVCLYATFSTRQTTPVS
jgi:hypothetical protein